MMCVEIRGLLLEVSSLLPYGFQDRKVWQQDNPQSHLDSPWIYFFQDRVSLCSSGCLETHSVDRASLELKRATHASASRMLGSKVCATTAQL